MSGSEKKGPPDREPVLTAREAVAVAYDPTAPDLPRVAAKGRGELAEELVRLALQHHIPIKYDPDLVQVLSRLDEGEALPEELYLVAAELLAFIYWVNQEYCGKNR